MPAAPPRRARVADILAPDANNLTLLRLVAALCVVASHCALLRTGSEAAEPLARLSVFSLGGHALNAFFFISGLTVAASLARARSPLDYVVARALRLWPALIAVAVVLALVVGPVVSTLSPAAYFGVPAWGVYVARTALLSGAAAPLPGVFASNPLAAIVNGSPWTLRFEAFCYAALLLGAFATARLPRTRRLWLPLSGLAAALFMVAAPAAAAATTLDHAARFWVAFALGATVYQMRERVSAGAWPAALAGAAFLVAIGGRFEAPAAILFIGALTLFAARWPLYAARRFANRADLSYGVYIAAWPVTQILVAAEPGWSASLLFVATASISLGLAWLSWTFVEKPALGARRRVVDRLERWLAPPPRLRPSGPR